MLRRCFWTYLEMDRPRKLAFSFTGSEEIKPTRATIEIEACDGGRPATVTHEINPMWANLIDSAFRMDDDPGDPGPPHGPAGRWDRRVRPGCRSLGRTLEPRSGRRCG